MTDADAPSRPTPGASPPEAVTDPVAPEMAEAEAAVGPPHDDTAEMVRPPAPTAADGWTVWRWVARPSRVQVLALVLISCLALGPVAATVAILRSDTSPLRVLAPVPPHDEAVTLLHITALAVSPAEGELRVRIAVFPGTELLEPSGRLAAPLTVGVNDARGSTSRTFEAGQTPTPFEASIPLSEGSINRYPFDRFESVLVVVTSSTEGEEIVGVPAVVEVRSALDAFVASAVPDAEATAPASLQRVEWTLSRPGTTTVYGVWLMVLMWALAVVGLAIVWTVIIGRVELPPWVFGYLVGVLFALPPLRTSLPGNPPPGTLFDFVSFYWAIAIVATSLILALVVWVRRARAEASLRDLDAG